MNKKEQLELLLKSTKTNLTDFEQEQLREIASSNSDSMIGMLSEIAEQTNSLKLSQNSQKDYAVTEASIRHYLTVFQSTLKTHPELINLKAVDLGCYSMPNKKTDTLIDLISKTSIDPILYSKAIKMGAKTNPSLIDNLNETYAKYKSWTPTTICDHKIHKVIKTLSEPKDDLNNWVEVTKNLSPHAIKAGASRLPKSVQQAFLKELLALNKHVR